MAANQTMDLTDLNEAFKMIKKEDIEVFFIQDHTCQTKTTFLGSKMHMMMQTLEGDDGPCLSYGLSVMNTYMEMTTGSKWVAVVVKNLTATPISIAKGVNITQVEATNVVPQVNVLPGTLEKLDEIQGIQQTRMSVEWRKEMLFQQLELSSLEGWSDKNQTAAEVLLSEYHDIFSLKTGELDCTDLMKHLKENFPTYGGWGPWTHEGNVGSGCYLPKPEPVV